MPKMRKRADLPTKTCEACGLPFSWRRKWARDWSAVKYCSDRCRRTPRSSRPATGRDATPLA
ncbi:MAG: DUF2256 domain-containing protein [Alphaproteobacteria bacterium]